MIRNSVWVQSLTFAVISLSQMGAFTQTTFADTTTITNIPAPERKHLFREDSKAATRVDKRDLKSAIVRDAAPDKEMDLRAPQIEYSRDGKTINGAGGVSLQSGAMSIESDTISVQTETKDTTFAGAVTVDSPVAKVVAANGSTNLNTEAGKFTCAKVQFEESNFTARAGEVRKLDDERFELDDTKFTTCGCDDSTSKKGASAQCSNNGIPPWSIDADTASVTRDGYAHAHGATVKFQGVPIFYSPYLGFPIKEQRQSGLLFPQLGYSSRDGMKAKIPLFITMGETADVTLAPFIETQSRTGLSLDYRQKYSRYNQLESRFYYSDESARDGSLRGTNVDGLFDPTFDENRSAIFMQHYWKAEKDAPLDLTYISDIHYVSDDLFLREMPDSDLGEATQTSTVSRALVRAGLGEYGVAELSGEYVQALDNQNDDLVFQRLPEFNLNLSKSFRPFGYNDYGLKLVTRLDYLADDFSRSEAYDGVRSHAVPSVTLPFHVGPYAQGSASISLLRTDYWLDNTSRPQEPAVLGAPVAPTVQNDNLDDSNDRTLPIVSAGVSTALERVYAVDKDSWLAHATSWGAANQDENLVRIKHTIEPFTRFTAIPHRNQDDLPIFDSIDRISEKRSLSYGIRTSLYGRFLPPSTHSQRDEDLVGKKTLLSGSEVLSSAREQEDLGRVSGGARVVDGDSRELVTFVAKQNFDILEYNRDLDPNSDGFSDIDTGIYMFPTPQFAVGLESGIDAQDGKLSSWSAMTDFTSDRGDILRARWTFVRDSATDESLISQFEGNAEVVLTNQLRAGIYSRMDALNGVSLENRAALRWLGSCRCWSIDLGYGQRANPDKREVLLSFTLRGLGDIAQAIRVDQSRQ